MEEMSVHPTLLGVYSTVHVTLLLLFDEKTREGKTDRKCINGIAA